MIGQIGAPSPDAISDLKSLLELAADPKKLSKAVAELEEASAAAKLVIDEKARIEADVDRKLKQLEIDGPQMDSRVREVKVAEAELEQKQKIFDAGLSDLEYREQALAREKAALQVSVAKHLADVEKHKKAVTEHHAAYLHKNAEASAVKEQFEIKMAKLKQAMA